MRNAVVGYDGSDAARRALERAAELADEGANVTVVSAVRLLAGKGGVPFDPVLRKNHEQDLERARARLAELGMTARTVEGSATRPGSSPRRRRRWAPT
jgi:nucleotide-binding universal stress UspA family protein